MTRIKQFGLATLFVVGVTLFTNSPAVAEDWGTITLTNTAAAKDSDHGASGQATLTDVTYFTTLIQGEFPYQYADDVYTGYLTLRCEGLTPRATYAVGPTSLETPLNKKAFRNGAGYSDVTASDTGTVELAVQVTFYSGCSYQWVEVDGGPWWDDNGYWELIDCSYGYPLDVIRRQGRRISTQVLAGGFVP